MEKKQETPTMELLKSTLFELIRRINHGAFSIEQLNDLERRIFSKCYWTVLKAVVDNSYGRFNLRDISEKNLDKHFNYLSKLINRNTFPTEEVRTAIYAAINDPMLETDKVIPAFTGLSEFTQEEALQSLLQDERNRSSAELKKTESMITKLGEEEIHHVYTFVSLLTNPSRKGRTAWAFEDIMTKLTELEENPD